MDKGQNRFYKKVSFWIGIGVVVLVGVALAWALQSETVEDSDIIDGETIINDGGTDEEDGAEGDRNQEYLGLSEEAAGELAESRGLAHRVVHRDGEDLPITMDFNPNRMNFWVVDGLVIQALTDEEMTAN